MVSIWRTGCDAIARGFKHGEVTLRFKRAHAMIGVALPVDEMVGILTSLGLSVVQRDEATATFKIPSFRLEVDLLDSL